MDKVFKKHTISSMANFDLHANYAVELRSCSELRDISLENNRLATPVLDLRAVSQLSSLQLFGNPLEFLPELSPCRRLRKLSLANVRRSFRCCMSLSVQLCIV